MTSELADMTLENIQNDIIYECPAIKVVTAEGDANSAVGSDFYKGIVRLRIM